MISEIIDWQVSQVSFNNLKMFGKFLISALAFEASVVTAFPHLAEQAAKANAERSIEKSKCRYLY